MVKEYSTEEEAYGDYKKIMKLNAKKEMLKTFIWCLPGSDARKNNAPSKKQCDSLKYKSEAIINLENSPEYVSNKNGIPSNQFIGDHIVPRKIILKALLNESGNSESLSEEEFKNVIKMAVVCLVSHEEDERLRGNHLSSKMPEGWEQEDRWDKKDIWARYKQANITVYEKQLDGGYKPIKRK